MLAPWKKSYDKHRQHIKKQETWLTNKGLSSQSYGFPSSHVWMWELDRKEGWASKNWCFFFFNSFIYFNWRLSTLQYCSGFCHTLTWISQIDTFWAVVLEKSPLDSKETKPVNPKWNESWIFIGRTDAEAEAPIVWPPDAKSQLVEDKTVGWYHQLNGHEFEQALRDGEGQGSLVCCSPCGCKELDMTGWLNNDDSCF